MTTAFFSHQAPSVKLHELVTYETARCMEIFSCCTPQKSQNHSPYRYGCIESDCTAPSTTCHTASSRPPLPFISFAFVQILLSLSQNALLGVLSRELTPTRLGDCMAILPESLHPLALEAQCLSIRDHNLELPDSHSPCDAHQASILLGISAHTHLTSLSLGSRLVAFEHQDSFVLRSYLFNLFSSLRNLQHLGLKMGACAAHTAALIDSMHSLTSLRSLNV